MSAPYRVTTDEVKEIISTTLTDCTPQIAAANMVVDKHLSSNSNFSTNDLKEIERWLAAHFVSIYDPEVKSEKIGDAQISFNMGKLGEGLKYTKWGQQALLLDHSGVLAEIGLLRAQLKAIDLEL